MPDGVSYPGVYIEELPSGVHPIAGVDPSITAFVGRALCGPVDDPIRLCSFAEYEATFGGLWAPSPMSFAVQQYFQNGGAQALVVRASVAADPDGAAVTAAEVVSGARLESAQSGIFALEKADRFNVLCIPTYSPSDDVEPADLATALAYCARRRAMLLVDPPAAADSVGAAQAHVQGLARHENGAFYFPRILAPNPLRGNAVEPYAPCGAVAGVWARTDAARGVWKAPAGVDAPLVGVVGLAARLSDAETEQLNPLGINCLRDLPVHGRVVWGARTLRGADDLASEWKYIPVRRTALFLEESLARGTQWAADEPNDEPLWAQIRASVGAFLQHLFRQGAFQGRTPREAYFVRCDRATTTQGDIDRGRVNITVGFAPLKPAEFVVITLQQSAGCAGSAHKRR